MTAAHGRTSAASATLAMRCHRHLKHPLGVILRRAPAKGLLVRRACLQAKKGAAAALER